jgi:hypothetical protein
MSLPPRKGLGIYLRVSIFSYATTVCTVGNTWFECPGTVVPAVTQDGYSRDQMHRFVEPCQLRLGFYLVSTRSLAIPEIKISISRYARETHSVWSVVLENPNTA